MASVAQPVKELKGFRKLTLQPGETAVTSFILTEEQLRFYGLDHTYTSEPGEFRVFVGPDSRVKDYVILRLLP